MGKARTQQGAHQHVANITATGRWHVRASDVRPLKLQGPHAKLLGREASHDVSLRHELGAALKPDD